MSPARAREHLEPPDRSGRCLCSENQHVSEPPSAPRINFYPPELKVLPRHRLRYLVPQVAVDRRSAFGSAAVTDSSRPERPLVALRVVSLRCNDLSAIRGRGDSGKAVRLALL